MLLLFQSDATWTPIISHGKKEENMYSFVYVHFFHYRKKSLIYQPSVYWRKGNKGTMCRVQSQPYKHTRLPCKTNLYMYLLLMDNQTHQHCPDNRDLLSRDAARVTDTDRYIWPLPKFVKKW